MQKKLPIHGTNHYQDRYVAHQLRKKATLKKLLSARHSTRVFAEKKIPRKLLKYIIASLAMCPSSCDRQGVYTTIVESRDDKELLAGLLVGGVGWLHRAPVIILLFADPLAYKENLAYMPFIDAGVKLYHLYLMAEAHKLKACYVNPNVRTQNALYFSNRFSPAIFCGAVALGYAEQEK